MHLAQQIFVLTFLVGAVIGQASLLVDHLREDNAAKTLVTVIVLSWAIASCCFYILVP